MKRHAFCSSLFVVFLIAPPSRAATIWLTNSMGGTTLDLATTGDMQIRVQFTGGDAINGAFINAFLDTIGLDGADADAANVITVTAGAPVPPWIYDRSAFTLPAELDETGNEYGLVSGDPTPDGGYPPGITTWIHDTLTLENTDAATSGSVEVRFELGARQPQVFGPAPTYTPYTNAPPGFPPGLANFLYIGDSNSNNPPFVIHLIPEPAALTLLGVGGIALFMRRRGD